MKFLRDGGWTMTSEFISEPFITSPTTKKVFSLFDSLREKKSRFDVASCGLITGESGSGKSQLAKRYFQKNQPLEEENRRRIPVFHYELKEASTCLLYTSPSPRDQRGSRMPSSA